MTKPPVMTSSMNFKPLENVREVFRRFLVTSLTGKIALVYLIALYALVFLSPLFYHRSPDFANPLDMTQGPSLHHLLGTDDLGRDELARIFAGGKITLLVGVLAMVIAIALGGLLGSIAAFFKGWPSVLIMRFVDMMLSIPSFFLVLIEITSFGHSPSVVIIVVGLAYWAQIARVVYAEVLKWRDSALVEAAAAIGATQWRILFRHVIPQIFSSIMVLATLGVGWAILAESGLSYLGLGIQPPQASWGNMLQNSQTYIWTDPSLGIYPGVLIFTTVLAFSILGEATRDAFDPRLRRSR